MNPPLYDAYLSTMRKIQDLNGALAVLTWDKEVNLPPKGATFRSQQVATLSGMSHELFISEAFGETLQNLLQQRESLPAKAARNVTLTWKDYQKSHKLPTDFVIEHSKMVSQSYHAWLQARAANDFSVFQPFFKKVVELKRKEADLLGYDDHPYDAMLDLYEPEAKTADLNRLFADVREQLVAFVQEIRQRPQVNNAFLKKFYPKNKQWEIGIELLKNIGYDFDAGRQDLSTHPFTINFSPNDVRVTTRIDENDLSNMTWSCIHEGGHALYEQGLPTADYGLPTAAFCSLAIHESQSRLWENNVARSRAYWKAHYAKLQAAFPENLGDVPLEDFYKGINRLEPCPIRTESDELHYHFHILIRFEIEKGLMEGSLAVENLEEIWNEKYKSYLGLEITDAKTGILQDIHWSHGSIGYFPTYSLGSFYAAQFFAQVEKDLPQLSETIERGDNSLLLNWLRENIHQHGRYYSPDELCERITGEKLNFSYFMDYVKKKYNDIY